MFGKFFAKQKRIFLCAFGWPVSRVLSFKMIINLDMALLPCSSGHGNGRTAHMFQHLAPHGVYSELLSPIFRVSSYLTFSPLPFKGLYISVALFLRSPWLDVIKRDCSVVLGLSSLQAARLSNQREYYTTFYVFSQHQFLI